MHSIACKPAQHQFIASLALALSLLTGALAAEPVPVGPPWSSLTPAQQHVLAPLAKDWQQLNLDGKQKWLEIATRFPSMPADQQARMQERMREWSRMTPQQRGQARANFQQAQQVPSQDRQAQWEAYKALPKERKDALALQAAQPAAPPPASAQPGTRPCVPRRWTPRPPNPTWSAHRPRWQLRPVPWRHRWCRPGQAPPPAWWACPPSRPPTRRQANPRSRPGRPWWDRSTLLPKRGPQAVGPPVVGRRVAAGDHALNGETRGTGVASPEPQPFSPAPGLMRRMAAFCYEGVLLFGVLMISAYLYSSLTQMRHALHGKAGLQAFLFVILGIYFTWFWSRGGQTVAMRAWSIRVVYKTGKPLTQRRAFVRYLLSWLWFMPALLAIGWQGQIGLAPIFGTLGAGVVAYALLARLHPEGQFWHDAVCGTRLIDWRPAKATRSKA